MLHCPNIYGKYGSKKTITDYENKTMSRHKYYISKLAFREQQMVMEIGLYSICRQHKYNLLRLLLETENTV